MRPIKINDKYGYVDKRFELVIAPQFDSVKDIDGGFNLVRNKALRGIITPAGRYIPLPTKDNDEYQINEVNLVTFIGVWYDRHCIIDRAGNFLLSVAESYDSTPEKNEKIDNICRNLVGIKANNELVKEPYYLPAPAGHQSEISYEDSFKENLLKVKVNGKYAYINCLGELAFP